MTDRELLELAAKAAGYTRPAFIDSLFFIPDPKKNKHEYITDWTAWNPLTDDGDALRLAVELGISIDTRGNAICVISQDGEHVALESVNGNEELPITRRAIVRIAAAIGKAMP